MEFLNNITYPTNSSGRILHEGNHNGKGILYCGNRYTSWHNCQCKTCDGVCGPNNGCPCPECDYILAYSLYLTGKMTCEKCSMTLIRLNLFNLQKLTGRYNAFICNKCRQRYNSQNTKVLHCFNCDYDLCPSCAFDILKTSLPLNNAPMLPHLGSSGVGGLYCGKKYANKCLCGSCDGTCGPTNGCPCPICDIIFGYNIMLNWNRVCTKCNKGNILEKSTLKIIRNATGRYKAGFICNNCKKLYFKNYLTVYHCYNCDYDICSQCVSKYISMDFLKYPPQILKKITTPNQYQEVEDKKESNVLRNKKVDENNEKRDIEDSTISNDERQKLENLKCVICLEQDKNVVFLPCNHMVCCEECANSVDKCPMCRKSIVSRIKVFM